MIIREKEFKTRYYYLIDGRFHILCTIAVTTDQWNARKKFKVYVRPDGYVGWQEKTRDEVSLYLKAHQQHPHTAIKVWKEPGLV